MPDARRQITDADMDVTTAYHEAGHAWVVYWHFIRKGWCTGVELTMEDPEAPESLGRNMARGLREPDGFVPWLYYAAHSAAGCVAENLWAERAGVYTWEESKERMRRGLDEDRAAFEEWGLEELEDGDSDLTSWITMGLKYGQPIDFEIYWKGYGEAEWLLRRDWPGVRALAEALLEKRQLTQADTGAIFGEAELAVVNEVRRLRGVILDGGEHDPR